MDRAALDAIEALQRAVEELSEQDAERRSGPEARLAAQQEGLVRLDLRHAELEKERESLRAWIDEQRGAMAGRRDQWIGLQRKSAVGESLAALTTLDGRTFEKVEITKVTDVGLEIRHAHGSARVRCGQLGPAWWQRFEWSADQGEQRLEEEREVEARLALAVRTSRQREAELMREQKAEADAAAAAERELAQARVASRQSSYASPLSEPSRPVGRSSRWFHRSYHFPDRYSRYDPFRSSDGPLPQRGASSLPWPKTTPYSKSSGRASLRPPPPAPPVQIVPHKTR